MTSGRNREGYQQVSTTEEVQDDDFSPATSSATPSLTPTSQSLSLPLSQPRLHPFSNKLSSFFYSLGYYVSSHPYLVIAIALSICAILNLGWSNFEIETDPVKLWVAESSEAYRGKQIFDDAFGETWRTQQVFVWSNSDNILNSSSRPVSKSYTSPSKDNLTTVLSYPVLLWWEKVEEEIRALKSSPNNYTWGDVCFNPTASASSRITTKSLSSLPATDDTSCVIQSFLNYFVDEPISENRWKDRLNECVTTPASCLGPNGPLVSALITAADTPTTARR
jgi:Niemann-Pick C1 protein